MKSDNATSAICKRNVKMKSHNATSAICKRNAKMNSHNATSAICKHNATIKSHNANSAIPWGKMATMQTLNIQCYKALLSRFRLYPDSFSGTSMYSVRKACEMCVNWPTQSGHCNLNPNAKMKPHIWNPTIPQVPYASTMPRRNLTMPQVPYASTMPRWSLTMPQVPYASAMPRRNLTIPAKQAQQIVPGEDKVQ